MCASSRSPIPGCAARRIMSRRATRCSSRVTIGCRRTTPVARRGSIRTLDGRRRSWPGMDGHIYVEPEDDGGYRAIIRREDVEEWDQPISRHRPACGSTRAIGSRSGEQLTEGVQEPARGAAHPGARGGAALPAGRSAEGLPLAGCEHPRQAHRDHHPPAAAPCACAAQRRHRHADRRAGRPLRVRGGKRGGRGAGRRAGTRRARAAWASPRPR